MLNHSQTIQIVEVSEYVAPNEFVDFLHEWQDISGAFLGAFLAVILSGIGYLIARAVEQARERKETLRKIEVSITYTLNSIHNEQEKLRKFIAEVRKLVGEIRATTNPREFAMHSINAPTMIGVYLNEEIIHFRINSYYLHNKLLWVHSGIKDTNATLLALPNDYDRVLKMNETMINLMTSSGSPNPPAQRTTYANNLEALVNGIEKFCNEELPKAMTNSIQVKVYNEKFRKPFPKGKFEKWKHEGRNFRYFRTQADYEKFARNLESIDRIDKEIESDVKDAQEKMRQRAEKLKNIR